MTRQQFIDELITMWSDGANKIRKEYGECTALKDIETALRVLAMTYTFKEIGIKE